MNASPFLRRVSLVLCFSALARIAFGQAPQIKGQFEPEVGQAGKDVVWVPTPQLLVERLLDLAKTASQDYVIGLGSGDGGAVITAPKPGAGARALEYNPDVVPPPMRS